MPDVRPIVYVIDDDVSVRESLELLIQTAGWQPETYASAQAFLSRPQPTVPCCLVLDVTLPGLSGLELQKQLAGRTYMPIIFITGHGNVPMSVRAMKGGALDFLQKPFHDQELLDAIQRALAHSRSARLDEAERASIERRLATLTPRELEVLRLVVRGMLNKQIAAELGAAEKTVKVHRGRVMKKMQVDSVAEVVKMTQRVDLDNPRA
jgi:FixJ family two-component response regulator